MRTTACPPSPTTVCLLACALVLTFATSLSAQQPLGIALDGAAAGDRAGFSVAVSGDGARVAVGAMLNDDGGEDGGHVRVFGRGGTDGWTSVGLAVEGSGVGDNLGQAVALSGDGEVLAAGVPYADIGGGDAGLVRVLGYDEVAEEWRPRGQDILGEAPGDLSGAAVSLSSDGDRVAVGAYRANLTPRASGQVRVYDFDAATETWVQLGEDIDGGAAFGQLGWSVSLSGGGTRVAVGAPFSNVAGPTSGQVTVYDYDEAAGAWRQVGAPINGAAAGDVSGWSVALSRDGSHVAVGAPYSDRGGVDAGEVRVYAYDDAAGIWQMRGMPLVGRSAGDLVGASVALSAKGERVVFGAVGQDNGGDAAGQACLYDWDAGAAAWRQAGLDVDGGAAADQFGTAVSLSDDGESVIVGAPFGDANGADAGQARVYGIDPIGEATVSNTTEVSGPVLSVGPNPAREFVAVSGVAVDDALELTLYDGAGREVARGERGGDRLTLPTVASGVHTLVVRYTGGVAHRRIVLAGQ